MNEDDFQSQREIAQPPSCVEFCPADPSILAVGTYKLEESQTSSRIEGTGAQSRSGRLEVYQIKKKSLSPGFGISQYIDHYDFPDCAVLDLHFHPQRPSFFAVCTSISEIVFFSLEGLTSLQNQSSQPSLQKIGVLQVHEDPSVLATSFAWQPWPIDGSDRHISFAVTFSSGEIKLFVAQRGGIPKSSDDYDLHDFRQARIDPPHTLEAWTVVCANLPYGTTSERMLVTGGDDSILALHSVEDGLDCGAIRARQLFRDRKSHGAGVTAILPILSTGHLASSIITIVTGSYDEHIRVLTVEETVPYQRKLVSELRLGGGIWRLRQLSESFTKKAGGGLISSVLILASCMHAGVRVVRVIREQGNRHTKSWCHWHLDVVGEFTEGHTSMCYAADSVDVGRYFDKYDKGVVTEHPNFSKERHDEPNQDDDQLRDFVVVSTSFYDRKICVWSFHEEVEAVEEESADMRASEETA